MKTLYIRTPPTTDGLMLFSTISDRLATISSEAEEAFFLVDDDAILNTSRTPTKDLLAMVEHYLYKYEELFNYRIDHILLVTKHTITMDEVAKQLPFNNLTTTIDTSADSLEIVTDHIWQSLR